MNVLGNHLTAEEIAKYLRKTERTITALESELAKLPQGLPRARAHLHHELHQAYVIAEELRLHEAAPRGENLFDLGRNKGVLS